MAKGLIGALAAGLVVLGTAAAAQETTVSHGLSLFGDLKYPPDFQHFSYVNPAAPKGGQVLLEAIGTFDTLNPWVIKGTAAAGSGLIYDSLMVASQDEASSEYGQVAETVEVAADLSWVAFNLRPEARWHDGQPLTAADVVFTLERLKSEGRPLYRYYYANVSEAVAEGPHRVRFNFTGPPNRELPNIIGQLPVLPRHYWEGREFNATTLDVPLGSGPYRIAEVKPGRSISYERVADYWGRDIPVNRGRYNYDHIRFEYYRDRTVSLEAFKTGSLDFRSENSAKVWATQYDFPAIRKGQVIKEALPDNNPAGMQAFVFNTRRAKFQDPRVRQALGYAFDFEWSNVNLFYGQYTRTESFFANSELAARELPDAAELSVLEPLRGQVPDEVFTTVYAAPRTDGRGGLRQNLRQARRLLSEAGWVVRDGKLVNEAGGESLDFEILVAQPDMERVVAPMVQNLKRLGVTATLRVVDTSQYVNRVRAFEFDMIVSGWGQTLSPGNEQREFWGTAAADRPGSRNLVGIKDPAIDKLIDGVIYAEDRAQLLAATRALDRVLLWNHFVIPQFHVDKDRIAYWNRFGRPDPLPRFSIGFADIWWIDPARDAALQGRLGRR